MVILVFKTLGGKTQPIPAEDEQTLQDLIPAIVNAFNLETSDPQNISFIYAGKIFPITTKVKDINFQKDKFIILRVKQVKPAPQPTPKPEETPAAAPQPQQPATPAPAAPTPANPAPQPPSRPPTNPNMTDEEFITTSINNLPSKEKFDENLAEVMAFSGADRDTAVRALIQTSNSTSLAINLVLDNKVRTIAQMKNSSAQHSLDTSARQQSGRMPSITQRFKEIAKRVPGMDPDNTIKSSIVPPTIGKKIPTVESYFIANSLDITQKLVKVDKIHQIQALIIRDPRFLQMLLNHPSIASEEDKSRVLAKFGLMKLENGELVAATELPTSKLFALIPDDFSESDMENVFQICARNFGIEDVLSYYEACNRDPQATLSMLASEVRQLRAQQPH